MNRIIDQADRSAGKVSIKFAGTLAVSESGGVYFHAVDILPKL